METQEKTFAGLKISGFIAIFMLLLLIILSIVFIKAGRGTPATTLPLTAFGVAGLFLALFGCFGFMQIEPNDARVMIFFGKYKGTIADNGFFWVNPFYVKRKLTLRARNLDIPPIKVNDKVGNPVMIGLVLVWKIQDTYKATFDIDTSSITRQPAAPGSNPTPGRGLGDRMKNYENFVKIQSDSALRKVASLYAYDNLETGDYITLRSGDPEITARLEQELDNRLAIAGIKVVEASINYLAYASEIAGVMLRRQQADAIIAAREKIVEGAVSMVHMALNKLTEDEIVELDDERKAAMVSNLLVVLCADEAAQPVINTGTLHH